MAGPAVTSVVEVQHFLTLNGQLLLNVLHYRSTTLLTNPTPDASEIATFFAQQYTQTYVAIASRDLAYDHCVVKEITGKTANAPGGSYQNLYGVTADDFAQQGVTGGAPSDSMPPTVAISCRKITGIAGRSFHGRTALPGLPEQSQVAGTIDPAYVVALNAILQTWNATQQVAAGKRPMKLVLFPRAYYGLTTPGADLNPVGVAQDLVQYKVHSLTGTQRSRRFTNML
jgi:hypothetical protein